jgi:hypothetical protein
MDFSVMWKRRKAAYQCKHRSRTVQVQRVDESKNLRQQVKGYQADQNTCRKTQDQIKMNAIAQPEKTANERREECR